MTQLIGIIVSAIFCVLYIFMFYFITGHGGKSIAGYHFEPTNKEALKYHKYIMRRIGFFGLFLIAIIHTLTLSGIYKFMPLCYTMIAILPIYAIVGIIWFNKSKKIKNAMRLERELDKKSNEIEDYNKDEDSNRL